MKASFKFGLLGLFVAIAVAFGIAQTSGVAEAQAPPTKVCTLTGPGTADCVLTFAGLPAGQVVTVVPTGSAFVIGATLTTPPTAGMVTVMATPGMAGPPVVPGEVTITCAAAPSPACTTFRVTETLGGVTFAGATTGDIDLISDVCTPFAPGVLNCDLSLSAGTTLTLAQTFTPTMPAGAAAVLTPAPLVGPLPAGAVIDLAVTGGNYRLTGTVPDVIITNTTCATVGVSPADPAGDAPLVTVVRITVGASGCPAGQIIQLSQKINCTATTITQTGTLYLVAPFPPTAGAVAVDTDTITATGPGGQPLAPCGTLPTATVTKVCLPQPDGVPATTTVRAFVRQGQQITCTVTVTPPAGTLLPGTATVTLTTAGTFVAPGSGQTGTFTITPAAGGLSGTFSETFFVTETLVCTNFPAQTIALPGLGTVTAPVVAASPAGAGATVPIFILPKAGSNIICPGDVVPIGEADTIVITCTSNVAGTALTNQFPSPIGLVDVGGTSIGQLPGGLSGASLAVGVLPGAVSCIAEAAVILAPGSTCPAGTGITIAVPSGFGQVVPANVFCRVTIAPGTFEVSSISGSILTLSGTLATNVRIPCGSGSVVFTPSATGATINPNNCIGVRFSVLGLGVGNVEIRVRYEPAPDFGQRELEASGFVSFVAPAVGVSLTLNPNPVAVGQTGTATAFLNQLFVPNCGTIACVDPATGLPITVGANPGSILNGIVVFTIDNTAIARFNQVLGTITATGATPLNQGVFATANQVAQICGAFSGGSTTIFQNIGGASSPLAAFFGGCTQAATTYLGVEQGVANVSATFIPFLPGVSTLTSAITGTSSGFALGPGFQGFNFFAPGIGPASTFRQLQVAGAAPATTQTLVPGCNNVVAPANETVAQVAARVDPASAAVSIWKQVPGTVMFMGAPVGGTVPAGVANLTNVNALDAIFICVSARATYRLT